MDATSSRSLNPFSNHFLTNPLPFSNRFLTVFKPIPYQFLSIIGYTLDSKRGLWSLPLLTRSSHPAALYVRGIPTMKRLRFLIVTIVLWLFLLYNIVG